MPKAHPADPRPTAERNKPRPHERRKRRLRITPPDPEKYPNLKANRALDRALHIHRAMQMGVPREQAIRDADEHLAQEHGAAARKQRPAPTTRVRGSPRSRTRVKRLQ
ncbi:MAG TPA: hypothetical protein VHI93_06540 [Candidatus Thermoplasmatota archaeon]|nr:hypothetical protein [Candidatus Thermoplasmatota archaeon]